LINPNKILFEQRPSVDVTGISLSRTNGANYIFNMTATAGYVLTITNRSANFDIKFTNSSKTANIAGSAITGLDVGNYKPQPSITMMYPTSHLR
jgi:hypothetical protein